MGAMNLMLKYSYHMPGLQMLAQYSQQFLLPVLTNSAVPDELVETAL